MLAPPVSANPNNSASTGGYYPAIPIPTQSPAYQPEEPSAPPSGYLGSDAGSYVSSGISAEEQAAVEDMEDLRASAGKGGALPGSGPGSWPGPAGGRLLSRGGFCMYCVPMKGLSRFGLNYWLV
jgi:hypothetical protein